MASEQAQLACYLGHIYVHKLAHGRNMLQYMWKSCNICRDNWVLVVHCSTRVFSITNVGLEACQGGFRAGTASDALKAGL